MKVKYEIHRDSNGDIQVIPPLVRVSLALTDIIVAAVIFFLLYFVSYSVILPKISSYSKSNDFLNQEKSNTGLTYYSKNDSAEVYLGTSSYYKDEGFIHTKRGKYNIINALSYYYLSYMAGNEVTPNYHPSSLKDETLTLVDGSVGIPSAYYTTSWFNKYVFSVDNPNSYFTLVDGDYNQVAVFKGKYVNQDGTIKNDETMDTYFDALLNIAQNNLQNLPYIKAEIDNINYIGQVDLFICSEISIFILFILIPLFSSFGRTIGMRLDKIGLINLHGEKANKFLVILRFLYFVALIGIVLGIPLLAKGFYPWNYVILGIYVIVNIILLIVKKPMIHDYGSFTRLTFIRKIPKIDLENLSNNGKDDSPIDY